MDSAIGLSTMIAIGPDGFADLLAGFHAMDEHFSPLHWNPTCRSSWAYSGVWNRNFIGCATVAVLPYEQYPSASCVPAAADNGVQR